MGENDLSARSVCRGAAALAVMTLVGMPLGALASRDIGNAPLWPRALSMVVAVALLALLGVRRHSPSIRLGSWLFLAIVAVVLVTAWTTNEAYAASGLVWVPFQSNKLLMLVVAVLSVELEVGLLSIGACVGVAGLQTIAFSDVARAHFATSEPVATFAVAVFAAMTLLFRVKQRSMEHEVLRARADAAALKNLARVLLGVRDLTNTPLQTIAFSSAMVREHHPDLVTDCDAIDLAVADMKALNARLAEYEHAIDWSDPDGPIAPLTPSSTGKRQRP